jgi:hypothetical protein
MKKSWLCAITILVATCSATPPSIPQLRMTATEITSGDKGDSQIGSSKLAGVHTRILAGNPSAAGFYSILLFVPPHTTIQRHTADARAAGVDRAELHRTHRAIARWNRCAPTAPLARKNSVPAGLDRLPNESAPLHFPRRPTGCGPRARNGFGDGTPFPPRSRAED